MMHEVAGDVTVQVAPPGLAVIVYVATAPPPLAAGLPNVIVAWPLPATAVGAVGVTGSATTQTAIKDVL